jgi:hypothetical protein
MSCLTQFGTFSLIHHYCDIGVWTRMVIKFSERVSFVDERADKFLTILAQLGGYCTAEQAQAMELAKSASQTLSRLNSLEQTGFLRRVAEYPVVYQITKSVVRLVGTDISARRRHAIQSVRWRLAAVSFYVEAKTWPADFIFQHREKIAAFNNLDCPQQLLPHRGGQPYLWEDFVLDLHDGAVCVALVDRPHWNALRQMRAFVRRFAACRSHLGDRLSLTVAVGSDARRRLYERAARHRKVLAHAKGASEPATVYQLSTPIPHLRAMNHEPGIHTHEPVIHTNSDSRRP